MTNQGTKLIKGSIMLAGFYYSFNYVGGADGMTQLQKRIASVIGFLPMELADILSNLLIALFGIFMVYLFVGGLYRVCTFQHRIPLFEDKGSREVIVSSNEKYPNINRVLRYRESRLAALSNEDAITFMRDTAILDVMYSGYSCGYETERVLSYTESKLASMSSDRALNFLTNNLK